MQPKLEKLGLDWATFQVLRKTNASLSKRQASIQKWRPIRGATGLDSVWNYPSSDMSTSEQP